MSFGDINNMNKDTQKILGGSSMIVGGGTTISNSTAIGMGASKALADLGVVGVTATGVANLASLVGLTIATCGVVFVSIGIAEYFSVEHQKA